MTWASKTPSLVLIFAIRECKYETAKISRLKDFGNLDGRISFKQTETYKLELCGSENSNEEFLTLPVPCEKLF